MVKRRRPRRDPLYPPLGADGEVLCVGASALRELVFLTLPNDVELASLLFPILLAAAAIVGTFRATAVALAPQLMSILSLEFRYFIFLLCASSFARL